MSACLLVTCLLKDLSARLLLVKINVFVMFLYEKSSSVNVKSLYLPKLFVILVTTLNFYHYEKDYVVIVGLRNVPGMCRGAGMGRLGLFVDERAGHRG